MGAQESQDQSVNRCALLMAKIVNKESPSRKWEEQPLNKAKLTTRRPAWASPAEASKWGRLGGGSNDVTFMVTKNNSSYSKIWADSHIKVCLKRAARWRSPIFRGRGDFSLSSNIGFQCREDVLQSGGLIELNCFINKIVPNKPNLV
jgi:hypothetical protein